MEASHQLGVGFLIMAAKLNDWLIRFVWVAQLAFALIVGGVVLSALDREPPFSIQAHDPIYATAGQWASIDVPVKRDLTRHCDVEFDRYLFDAKGKRFDLGVGATASDKMIRQIETISPGRMKINMQLPPVANPENPGGVQPGPARMVTELRYVCNKGHRIWPINVQTEVALLIAP